MKKKFKINGLMNQVILCDKQQRYFSINNTAFPSRNGSSCRLSVAQTASPLSS
jgi:hypothetical protein